ncbi:MAG: hypothetical protein DMG58_01160 [Acidobacteria bacterium]|nr:MAG: hypothetical protein DMG58_01160 [Acidobacteriota bacterium]
MPIVTVTGPISAPQAGYTLSHEHLLIDLWNLTRSYDGILDDECLAIRELAEYRQAGGGSLVDATSGGLGRNPVALRRISEGSGIRIIMGAGWYRERVYPAFIHERDTNDLADLTLCAGPRAPASGPASSARSGPSASTLRRPRNEYFARRRVRSAELAHA